MGPSRTLGRRSPPAPGLLPTARALGAAAVHQATATALSGAASTGIVKGVYRFASHEQAQAQAEAALARVMASRASQQRASR